jgi:UDP-2,3-diacylglucosamine pyrophosphatase LpxH
MKVKKRKVEVAVVSDVHLGTYGCHAKEFLIYLKSIKPKILVINGDLIDIWQFSKSYWPESHMRVIKQITGMLSKGTKVYYITGNHDEMLRKFSGYSLGNLIISNKVVLNLDGKKAWIFHGDVFDVTMKNSKWLSKLGSIGYATLILLNKAANFISQSMGRGKLSFSKKIKNSVKNAVKYINDFEGTVADIGIDNGYDYVICGHIHQPEIRKISTPKGSITYLNSGDWIENLTSLEFNEGNWSLYHFDKDEPSIARLQDKIRKEPANKDLFEGVVKELKNMKA